MNNSKADRLLLMRPIERADRMSIEWGKSTRCWVGATRTGYARFEAWSSNGSEEGPWCLRVILNPGERPVEISRLPSLDEAKQFAEGMLMGLDRNSGGRLPGEIYDRAKEQVPCLARR